MAERSIIDRLDDAVAALAEGRQADLTNLAPELSALVEVAQGLVGLPRETFKAELQQQLIRRDVMSSPAEQQEFTEEQAAKDSYEGSVKEDKMRRENRRAITPYLTVHKPGELIDFVTEAFGGIEHFRATGSAGGMHAEVSIGDSVVMIGGAEHIEPMPTAIHLYVPNVDEAYERALKAGATSLMPVADQPYGERSGGVEDVHGNRWYIATPFVPLQEIAKDLHTVTVYFHPIGAQRFIDFVTNAFSGKELMRHAEGDMILHAKVQIGNSVIELGEARYETQPLPTAIYLYVDDVDTTYEQALNAGGVSMLAPTDQPYGDRNAWVKDPFANVWYIAAPIKT
ncbi:MAG TPA: VOC family protein [Pyrinomonadaceae bacterium]|nr:VOC family protein [Pyrinomonadaceae bacterium]